LNGSFMLSLLALFGISFGANATPFAGASYTLLSVTYLISMGFNIPNFVIVVLVTSLGATLAKLVIYSGAFGFRRQLSRNKNAMLFHQWLSKRSFYVTLFVTSFLPALPLDDYLYIGAGANKAKIAPLMTVAFPSKLLKSAVEIFLEYNGILGLSHFSGTSSLELSAASCVVFVILGIVLYKLDWSELLSRAGVKGFSLLPRNTHS